MKLKDDGTAVAAVPERVEGRPEGGFVFISVAQLAMAWWVYREGHIEFRDLRIWFGLWELQARRCKLPADREAHYRPGELLKLVGGVGEAGVRASLRRLERVGLARFRADEVSFPASPEALTMGELTSFWTMFGKIENRGRRVPVPRRTLELLAGGIRRVVMATVLAVLMRCIYSCKGGSRSGGRCAASWVEDVFRVDRRHVRRAREHLARLGWLLPFASDRWKVNRWGRGVLVNLAWSRDELRVSAPRRPDFSTGERPYRFAGIEGKRPSSDSDQTLPTELRKNQTPGQRAPAGGFFRSREEKTTTAPPTLKRVVVEDLRSTARLLELFSQAVSEGLTADTEPDRLNFVAAAEHALVIGSRNPSGLFVTLVRKRLCHFATQADEEAAQGRLKEHLYGIAGRSRKTSVDGDGVSVLGQMVAGLQCLLGGSAVGER